MRTFSTGATRDKEDGKLDFEGFLSPLVIQRFAEYMHEKRTLPGGGLRDSDNWQLGIPVSAYMKSLWRHFFSVWAAYRRDGQPTEAELCALMFNAQGMLHELLKKAPNPEPTPPTTPASASNVVSIDDGPYCAYGCGNLADYRETGWDWENVPHPASYFCADCAVSHDIDTSDMTLLAQIV